MLKDAQIKCPYCGQTTIIAVATPDLSGKIESKGSMTSCRSCRHPILTITSQDGTVQVLDIPWPSSEEIEAAGETPEEQPEYKPIEDETTLKSEQPGANANIFVAVPPPGKLFPAPPPKPQVTGETDADKPVALADVLKKTDGTRRTHQEAVKLYGLRATWVAELNEALEARLRGPKPLSIPPRIFVSYRWSSQEEDSWVENLVQELRGRGYLVVFDRTDCKPGMAVPEFVSNLGHCQTFLAILDPGYAQRTGALGIKMEDGWVFDEFNSAAYLANGGYVTLLGFLRRGNILPEGFTLPKAGKSGNVVDVRDPARLAPILNQLFPPITDLPPHEQIEQVAGLIWSAHEAALRDKFEAAWELAQRATQILPDIRDGHAQQARIAAQMGDAVAGLRAAARALTRAPGDAEMLSLAAGFAYHIGQFGVCMEYCVKLLELQDLPATRRYLHLAHYLFGNALDESGAPYPAIAHLEIARKLAPQIAIFHNDTGMAYRHIGNSHCALACFDQGLKLAPRDPMLLLNRAAAAAEAGDLELFTTALEELKSHDPGNSNIESLSEMVKSWKAGGPPQLMTPISLGSFADMVRCTNCPAHIPVSGSKSMLCAGCGTERFAAEGLCPFCLSDGMVMPALGFFMCPFCRNGQLRFSKSSNNPAASQ